MAKLLEWFNMNENRAYPIAEDATGTDNDGKQMPYALIADLGLTVPEDLLGEAFLRQLTITPTMISVSIAYSGGGLAVGTFAQPVIPHKAYMLTPVKDGVSGFIVFGHAATYITDPVSYTNDSKDQSAIEGNALSPIDGPGVTSFQRLNGDPENSLEGIIRIVPGSNITLDHDGNTIKIGLIDSVQTEFVGPCDKFAIFDACGGIPIRTINGVAGDENGIITLEVE